MSKVAIIYVRESTNKQDESAAVQEAKARAYAKLRDITIGVVIHDEATSAGIPFARRPKALAVATAIAEQQIDVVIATKLDRLFRDVVDCLGTLDQWDTSGVALHLLDLGGNAIDTKSAAGRFMLTVLAAAAELERNHIRERTRDALRHKRAKREVYGPTPFGFSREGVQLVPHNGHQETLAIMRMLRAQGMSFAAVASHLNAHGRPTARGGLWRASSVRGILRNAIHEAASA